MKINLILYLAGDSPSMKTTEKHVREMLKEHLKTDYELEVIDILQNPERAEKDKIFATPTLQKNEPAPKRKIMGNYSDYQKVFNSLEIP